MLYWADEMSRWNHSWVTGIYPGEMVAFLALCDVTGATSILESGRGQHAYSTQVLGEYAARTGAQVVSIDMEDSDPAAGAECRRLLSKYAQVECLVGDAFDLVPRAAARLPGPIALLLDGPKGVAANQLSLMATVLFPVGAIAHHNSEPDMAWTVEFSRFFPGSFHYEQILPNDSSPEWRRYKKWEHELTGGYELAGPPGRSLSQSSLVLSAVPGGRTPSTALLGVPGLFKTSAQRMLQRWQRIQHDALQGRS